MVTMRIEKISMKANFSDVVTKDYRVYLEPLLAAACSHMALKVSCRTMSKYIRRAVIRQLNEDGYPLSRVTSKLSIINVLDKGVSYNR